MARILLLHVSVGMGHQRAATALAHAFAEVPATTVQVEDTLDYAHGWFRRGYAGAYLGLADVAPALWSRYYAQTDRPNSLMDGVRTLTTRWGVARLAALVDRAHADAIICTHFLPIEALTQLRRRDLPPLYLVVTDYHAHQFWACPGVERTFVATPAAQAQLVAAGHPPRRVMVTGIPIDPVFRTPADRAAALRALDLPAGQPVVALVGSGLPSEQVRGIVQSVLARPGPLCLVVAAGRNHDLAASLAEQAPGANPRLHVLGPQPSLAPLLAASDLLISKAGGLTVSEALAIGVPLIIPTAQLVGQERWNAVHVIESGAGVGCQSVAAVDQAVAELLAAPARAAAMRAAARALGRPDAAAAIAAQVLADVERRYARRRAAAQLAPLPARAAASELTAKGWR
jgi:processive 1,2-diacylglycerol beta-glucosyltransferase